MVAGWKPSADHGEIRAGHTLHFWSKSDGQLRPFAGVRSLSPLSGTFHPDGDWIAYTASRIGTNDTQIFVEPFPPTGDRSQLTTRPGDNPHHPVWSKDGKRLFHIPRFSEFEYVPFSAAPAPSFGTPVAIYRAFPSAAPTEPRTFDIGPATAS